MQESSELQWVRIPAMIINVPAQLGTFINLILYLDPAFANRWPKSILKAFGIMVFYLFILAGFMAIYLYVISDWFL